MCITCYKHRFSVCGTSCVLMYIALENNQSHYLPPFNISKVEKMEVAIGNDEIDKEMILLTMIAVFICYNNRSYLTRSALLLPQLSPQARVFRRADDNSFLKLAGMSRIAFKIWIQFFCRGQ